MSGAILPLPQYAFMVWCSAKEQEQLYLFYTALYYTVLYCTVLTFVINENKRNQNYN